MTHRYNFQDFVTEQRNGQVHGIFIDDTGSPGLRNTPNNLHSDRKSWVAVVIPKDQIAEVWGQFHGALAELKQATGAKEFHFTDIYMGRKDFRDVPLNLRLAVFGFMAEIFQIYRFPIFVQTMDPDTLKDVRDRGSFPAKLGPFNLKKHEDLGLFLLLLQMKRHLEQTYIESDRRARVFVDEGYKKNGAAVVLKPLQSVFSEGLVCFARSDEILPIQLADFAAFCLNRTQLLMGKAQLSSIDESLLQILSPIAWNYQNIPKIYAKDWFTDNPSH